MPIKVLIVDDSILALTILQRILSSSPDLEVVGTATNGLEALEIIPKVKPDIICTDLHMPKMNGLELTSKVMQLYPCPILVISASVQIQDTHHAFDLLQAGAIDLFPKPISGLTKDYELIKDKLINKIKIIAGVKVFTKPNNLSTSTTLISKPETTPNQSLNLPKIIKIVGIGASTGGPQALEKIFSQLPATFPVPIICVQHISEGFLQGLIDWLKSTSPLPIKIANSGEIPLPRTIYFPPEKQHLELDSNGKFVYSTTPSPTSCCPSITVTFNSLAQFYGSNCLAVLLTGMGKDGADGMKTIANAGGMTIAQDEGTSIIFGMPKEAIQLGAVERILPIEAIADTIIRKVTS